MNIFFCYSIGGIYKVVIPKFSVANRLSSLKAVLLNQHTTSANNIIRIGYLIFIPSPIKGTKKMKERNCILLSEILL